MLALTNRILGKPQYRWNRKQRPWLWISSPVRRRYEISRLSNLASIKRSLTNLRRKNLRRSRIFSKADFLFTRRDWLRSTARLVGKGRKKKKKEKEKRKNSASKFFDVCINCRSTGVPLSGKYDRWGFRSTKRKEECGFNSFFSNPFPPPADKWSSPPTNRIRIWNVMYHHLHNNASARLPGHASARRFIYYDFSATPRRRISMLFSIQFPRNIYIYIYINRGVLQKYRSHLLYLNDWNFQHSRMFTMKRFSFPIFFLFPLSFFVHFFFLRGHCEMFFRRWTRIIS